MNRHTKSETVHAANIRACNGLKRLDWCLTTENVIKAVKTPSRPLKIDSSKGSYQVLELEKRKKRPKLWSA